MPEKIEVDVIPQDLRHEETIIQIADALDNLEFAVSHIFNCINNRISENGKKLDTITSRAEKIHGQLEYLQTNLSLKAVKMYSAPKYPASHVYKEYETIMKSNFKKDTLPSIYKSSVPIADTIDMHLTAGIKTENGQYAANINLQEKLQFYYVKSKPYKRIISNEKNDRRLLPGPSSVSALMLFDNYKQSHDRSAHLPQTSDKQELEDAPDSILQPWHSSEIESPSYLYAPALGEVPQINVPLTLPDLPGIVDDEKFVLDLNSQSPIAPSSATVTPTVRIDLPTPVSTTDEIDVPSVSDQTAQNLPNFSSDSKTTTSEVKASPPPPPPPPPPPSNQNPEQQTIASQSSVQVPPPPPPPPPPLVPQSDDKDQATQVEKKSAPAQVAKGTDDHTNLMAAIREAGGLGRAKLRPTAATEKPNNRWASASVGGDLMADLHAKLSLRRKGIAGGGMNAFERMSSMIPPPPKPNEVSDRNSATSEGDSQPDNDEWEE